MIFRIPREQLGIGQPQLSEHRSINVVIKNAAIKKVLYWNEHEKWPRTSNLVIINCCLFSAPASSWCNINAARGAMFVYAVNSGN